MADLASLIHRATKKKLKAVVAIQGFAGSGKTWSALVLASGLGEKTLLIDTEHRSAEMYADHFTFDHLPLDPPYSPMRYIEAIRAGEKLGYDVIVIDSLSHAWMGSGGVLDIQHEATMKSSSKNSYMAWGIATPEQNKLLDVIVNRDTSRHLIATLRTKAEYEQTRVDGKVKIEHIGTTPIQREGVPFEFDLVFELSQEHLASVVFKDRTKLFENKPPFMITQEHGNQLKVYLDEGEEPMPATIKDKATLITEINNITTFKELVAWNNTNDANINILPDEDKAGVVKARADRKETLLGGQTKGGTTGTNPQKT